MSGHGWIAPDWPAPANVRAVQTTRAGGVSVGPWSSLNLGSHCGDDPVAVSENRSRLRATLDLPSEPHWLRQVHGARVVELGHSLEAEPEADAAIAREPGRICAVLTADCLPVLLCDEAGSAVGAAHAGWRGLAGGVLEATVARLGTPEHLLAWLGPAIGPERFEVGDEVREAFVARQPQAASAFQPRGGGKHLADLYALALLALRSAGVRRVYGGGRCTHREQDQFFSFRRDGRCGRMATLIWRQ